MGHFPDKHHTNLVMAGKISASTLSTQDWPTLSMTTPLVNANWKNAARKAAKDSEEKTFELLLAQQPKAWISTCLGDVWGRLPPPGYRIVLIVDEEKSHSARTSFKAEYVKE